METAINLPAGHVQRVDVVRLYVAHYAENPLRVPSDGPRVVS
jgi:hypothetical protein